MYLPPNSLPMKENLSIAIETGIEEKKKQDRSWEQQIVFLNQANISKRGSLNHLFYSS